jgi:hypothetical protein
MEKLYKGVLLIFLGLILTIILTFLVLNVSFFSNLYLNSSFVLTLLYVIIMIPYLFGGSIIFDCLFEVLFIRSPKSTFISFILLGIFLFCFYLVESIRNKSFFNPTLLVILILSISVFVKSYLVIKKASKGTNPVPEN